MRKTIILALALLMMGQVDAQVAYWIIHPNYDSIYFATGANLIITDSLNEKIVWTTEGRRLFKTTDRLHSFCEGFAVATEKNSDRITGFHNLDGQFTPLEENCFVAHDYPYFSDGYLLVKKDGKYYYADTKGKLHGPKGHGFYSAYPLHNGFASCRNYKNLDRPREKEIVSFLIKSDNDKLQVLSSFSFNGKDFSSSDLEFISSVNDEGIGIVVAKHKVYYFKGENELEPVFTPTEENTSNNQAKLDGNISDCLIQLDNSYYVLYMNDEFSCLFNARMVPLEIGPNLKRIPFKTISTTKEKKHSSLVLNRKNNLFGLSIDGDKVLPPQFEGIYERFDNNAFVKASGKQGLLRVSKNEKFHAIINKGKEICFRHRTIGTDISITMPSFIPAEKTLIESCDTSCIINKTSWDPKKTPQGNSIEYRCELNFPQDLYDYILLYQDNPKQKTIGVTYPIQVISDGIKFPIINLDAEVWYYKSITIAIDESQKTVKNGTGTFYFDVNIERLSEDDFYPVVVDIIADSLYLEPVCEPLPSSNSRFKGTVYNLKEGANDIIIKVEESGCPPNYQPHTITYTKPSAKNKRKKEDIDIKKKTEEDDSEEELHIRF